MAKIFIKYFIHLTISLATLINAQQSASQFRQLPTAPLSVADLRSYNLREPNGPGTYAFGYELDDPASGNVQFRDEERLANGTVQGSFGHVRPDGIVSITKYVADDRGYRSEIQTYNQMQAPSSRPEHRPIQSPTQHINDDENQPSLSPELVDDILHQHQIDVYPSNDAANDPEITSIINGHAPVLLHTKEGRDQISLHLVNNFIPANFPIITFQPPTQFAPPPPPPLQPVEEIEDQYESDTVPFVNDKFHDPTFDIRKKIANRNRVMKKKAPKQQPDYPSSNTREALWFKELIRNRRKEYLRKYASNYDLHTIPANYVTN